MLHYNEYAGCAKQAVLLTAQEYQHCLPQHHPIQILIHLDIRWCPLNVQARKILKKEFYTNWDSSDIHITNFGMKLDKEQNQLDRLGIVISDNNKLQFYHEQIYASNCFNKTEIVTWENKPIIIKDDYTQAKAYFENIVKDFKIYTQNSGGKTGKMGYESANHMADVGVEIRKYNKERTAENLANISKVSRAKDAQIDSITAQKKLLADTVTLLSKLLANKENNGSGRNGSGGNGRGRNGRDSSGLGGKQKWLPTRNMGSYCWSFGHHPAGMTHGSHTCTHKKEGHKDKATATNCMGGNNFWPQEKRVKPSQHNYASYKGKSATR
jgi:hypothetical protein